MCTGTLSSNCGQLNMVKKSYRLLIISFVVSFFIIINGGFIVLLTQSIENDSKVINYSGIIRGTIQRITKLELDNRNSDEHIKYIDNLIGDFYLGKIMMKGDNDEFKGYISSLRDEWNAFKYLIYEYRKTPDDSNKNKVIEVSEKLWDKSNDTVFSAQSLSQKKVKYFYYTLFVSLSNLILIIIVIVIIKSYVKDRLEFQANHDPLTKVFNRNFFYEFMKSELYRSERYNNKFCFIMFDIDYFKKVNDNYGHDVGDYVLVELTRIVGELNRKNDILARIGGEEFVVVVTETGIEDAEKIAERLRKTVEEFSFQQVDKITISLGITQYRRGDTLDIIFKRADDALYMAKNRGRNRYEKL